MRYAYGISSLLPNQGKTYLPMHGLHYCLIDADNTNREELYDYLSETEKKKSFLCYDTKHGSHAIIFDPLPFPETARRMLSIPYCDKSFVAIGIKRGYWFLETKDPVAVLPNVQFMRIERT